MSVFVWPVGEERESIRPVLGEFFSWNRLSAALLSGAKALFART